MEIDHKHMESKNGIVHYFIAGNENKNAKWIVFTHGLTADHSMFEKQVEYFAVKYSVITWDVPLHGLSRPYSNFSYKNTAKELKRILDNENIPKVILVGMSMGGYPSQEFASIYKDMVEGFIALDTTPFGVNYYSKLDLWWLKKAAPIAKWFHGNLLQKSMAKSVSKTKYSYNKMIEMLSSHTKGEIIEQIDLAYGVFVKENKEVNFTFPLHLIKNAAHFSNGDNPLQVNREIEEFIQAL